MRGVRGTQRKDITMSIYVCMNIYRCSPDLTSNKQHISPREGGVGVVCSGPEDTQKEKKKDKQTK